MITSICFIDLQDRMALSMNHNSILNSDIELQSLLLPLSFLLLLALFIFFIITFYQSHFPIYKSVV